MMSDQHFAPELGDLGDDSVSEDSQSVNAVWYAAGHSRRVAEPHRFMALIRPISLRHSREQVL